jgi:phage shock protein E
MTLLKSLFAAKEKTDFAPLINKGAQIIDVRSAGEYAGGHIKGSINIPLPDLKKNLKKINKNNPVITCCASGMRSGSAKNILSTAGYKVYNGGGWSSLQNKI